MSDVLKDLFGGLFSLGVGVAVLVIAYCVVASFVRRVMRFVRACFSRVNWVGAFLLECFAENFRRR